MVTKAGSNGVVGMHLATDVPKQFPEQAPSNDLGLKQLNVETSFHFVETWLKSFRIEGGVGDVPTTSTRLSVFSSTDRQVWFYLPH
jgi:hypothetical protein